MQTVLTLETFLALLLAVALGAIVGVEREVSHKPAGLRTHMLVSLGACLFTMMSTSFGAQPAQVAGGIVAGIGFIGAGTIWAEKDKVHVVIILALNAVLKRIGLEKD
jgi:putative Mg2+ transporter-C (MgtC) family protein